ncbi:MAG: hypothetical protein IKW30_04370 [Lachnospiraceae bacterium]|nr:hypothetical protein [Lachnospiraceae bacterium]
MMMNYNATSNAYIMNDIETVYTYDEWLKEYNRNKALERQQKKETAIQKGLGIGLLAVGIIGCLVFPEDAGGFVFASIMGIIRTFN